MPNPESYRQELVRIQHEIADLEQRLSRLRDAITQTMTELFTQRHQGRETSFAEEALERVVAKVVSRLAKETKNWATIHKGLLKEREAALYMGVSVHALRRWRSKKSPLGPPFIKLGRPVLYPVTELENHLNSLLRTR